MEIGLCFLSTQLSIPCPISYLTDWLVLTRLDRWVEDFKKVTFYKVCINWWLSKEEVKGVCTFSLLIKTVAE